MRARLLPTIALTLLATASGFGATASTEPLGFTRQALHAGAQTVGVTLTHPVVFSASVVGNDAGALTLDTAGADAASLLASHASYYIEVVAGDAGWLVGDRIDIDVAASRQRGGSTLVLAPAVHNTLALPLAEGFLAGTRIAIKQHVTLAQVFGTADESELRGAPTFAKADQVLMFDRNTGGFVTFYLFRNAAGTAAEWRQVGSSGAKGGTVIAPGCGLFVRRQDGADVDLVVSGAVRTNDFVMPLASGYNFITSPFPVAGSPYSLQMTSANGFTAAARASDADQILVFNGTDYDTYFLHRQSDGAGEEWKRSAGDSQGFTTAELLTASSSVFVRKVQADPDFVAPRSFSL